MKKIILLLMFLICIPFIQSYVCQDDTSNGNIPCDVITPLLTNKCVVGGYNATVNSVNDTTINDTYEMSDLGDGTYNFSFNYSTLGYSYSILACDNSTATINIIKGEDPDINLWLVIFIVFFLLLIFGGIFHGQIIIGDILLFAAGGEMLVVGIWVFQSGISIYGVSEYWIYPMAWIMVGIGLILSLYAAYSMVEKEEEF